MLFRLTSLEDPSLSCTAEGEEITDAIGAVITTLYRAKKATFSATNSLISLELAAAQYGAKKIVAGETKDDDGNIIAPTITDYAYEILTIADGAVKLAHAPTVDSIKYIYTIENGEIGTKYEVGADSDVNIVVGDDGTITVPETLTGKIYVEYQFENDKAVRIVNKASEFPEACSVVIYAYFKDKCNENIVYSGKIVCPKAKLNPEQVELALTSTGKHAFEFTMMKDYCEEDGELFTIIVSE